MGGAVQRLFSLDDVVALVTGSSPGIGLAVARGLAEARARVVVNGRDPDKVAAAVAALKSEGLLADAVAFDVTDPQGVERGVTWIAQEIGSIQVLVNNAGIQRRAPLEDFPPETSRIYPAGKAGSSISRGCTANSRTNIAPYTASKDAVKMLTNLMTAHQMRGSLVTS